MLKETSLVCITLLADGTYKTILVSLLGSLTVGIPIAYLTVGLLRLLPLIFKVVTFTHLFSAIQI
jgi:hypothetical protein